MFDKAYSCEGKVAYNTWDEANRALGRSRKRTNEMKRSDRLHVYRCEHCPKWHMGHDSTQLKQQKQYKDNRRKRGDLE